MAEYIEREAVLKKMQLACRIALIDDDPEQCDIDFSDDTIFGRNPFRSLQRMMNE